MQEIYWVNCPLKEKKALKEIQRQKGWIDFLYFKKKVISKKKWLEGKFYLLGKLEMIERGNYDS